MSFDPESDSDSYEFVQMQEIADDILKHKTPDIQKIQQWLQPTDYQSSTSEFKRHLSSQAPGTGEWIRYTPQFNQWQSSVDHGSIWIKAVPGAGKSVIAASMIDSLAKTESVPVLFFFFRNIIERNRTSRSLIRDWISQLLEHSNILQASVWDWVENEKPLEEISTDRLWKLLLAGLKSLERVYCIVDALDEMEMDEDFLTRLDALGSFNPANTKVLLTSRPKQYLQRALKEPSVIHVSLEKELVKRDISQFVKYRINALDFNFLHTKTLDFIFDTICQRSEGLFLYARLMLDEILQCSKSSEQDDASIRDMVTRLPVGLEQMYNRILQDCSAATGIDTSVQLLILEMVTHSFRPLRLVEIAKAIEYSPLVREMNMGCKTIVKTACGPLLEIVEDEVVQILHHSFTEFLLDSDRDCRAAEFGPQFPSIQKPRAHLNMTLICLEQLKASLPELVMYHSSSAEVDANNSCHAMYLKFPFSRYALEHWTTHATKYDREDADFMEALESFSKPDTCYFHHWVILSPVLGKLRDAGDTVKPIHVAAGFGIITWLQQLIRNQVSIDTCDYERRTPLFWASYRGQIEAVDILLRAGAAPNLADITGAKPIHEAALVGRAGVVKLLLEAGKLKEALYSYQDSLVLCLFKLQYERCFANA
jgi:hypothetical protein